MRLNSMGLKGAAKLGDDRVSSLKEFSWGPKRIQRKRTKGWKMPPNAVYVGRGSVWGNPFRVSKTCSAQDAVDDYRRWLLTDHHWKLPNIKTLRGKNLACWCPLNKPCHADVLLELANPHREEK